MQTTPRRRASLLRPLGAAALGLVLPLTGASAPAAAERRPLDPTSREVSGGSATARTGSDRLVLVISVDGLNPRALHRLGLGRTPAIHRLMRKGARTRNARTASERTETLPNHIGMVTGRRVNRRAGGHGVWWNTDRSATTVHGAAGERVESIFSLAQRAGRSAAVFAGKSKFSILKRSWPAGVDRYVRKYDQGRLARTATFDLVRRRRAITFLHLPLPDRIGHSHGYLSPRYLRAVARTDRHVRLVLDALDARPPLKRRTVVILTSDHGGAAGSTGHRDPTARENYRIPFVVWGHGLPAGDLYRLSTGYADPGTARVGYARTNQPVRNLDVANLTSRLLGLGRVPGSAQKPRARLLDVG